MSLIKQILTVLQFTGATPPVGYAAVKEGRAEITIGSDTVQVPMVHQVDEVGNSIVQPVTDAQLRASALAVSASTLPLPTGAATETTLAQVRDAIKAQLALASTVWTDDSGAYYVRRDVINEGTGTVSVSFATPGTGAAATPGAGLRPLATAEKDVSATAWDATAAGTGYAVGDVLERLRIVDPNSNASTVIWFNGSSVIAAPAAGTVQRADEVITANIGQLGGAATDASLQALATAVTALTKHVAIQNLILSDMHDRGETSLRSMLNDPNLLNY